MSWMEVAQEHMNNPQLPDCPACGSPNTDIGMDCTPTPIEYRATPHGYLHNEPPRVRVGYHCRDCHVECEIEEEREQFVITVLEALFYD